MGGGGGGTALFLRSAPRLCLSLCSAMPSLLVLAGIMEKSGGGYGADLAAGYGSDASALLVPPDEEEEEDESRRALRVALGQLSLLGLGEGEGDGGAPNPGLQDRSNNNNNLAGLLLPGKGKLSALYDSPPSPVGDSNKGRGCNITECVPVPSSEHVAEIVGRQGKVSPVPRSSSLLKLLHR